MTDYTMLTQCLGRTETYSGRDNEVSLTDLVRDAMEAFIQFLQTLHVHADVAPAVDQTDIHLVAIKCNIVNFIKMYK